MSRRSLKFCNAKKFGHFVVKKAFARPIGLHPSAIDDKLRDGTLAGLTDDLLGSTRRGFDIHLFVGNVVLLQKALGHAAVRASEGGIDEKLHLSDSQSAKDLARERRYQAVRKCSCWSGAEGQPCQHQPGY